MLNAANWTRNEQIWDIASREKHASDALFQPRLPVGMLSIVTGLGCHFEGNGRLTHNKVEVTVKNAVASESGYNCLRL